MPLHNVSDGAVRPPHRVRPTRPCHPSLTVGNGLTHDGRPPEVMALTGAERQRRYMDRDHVPEQCQ